MGVEERKLKLKRFESVIKAAMTLVEIGDIGDIIADDRSQKTTFTALQQNSSFIKQSYTINSDYRSPTISHLSPHCDHSEAFIQAWGSLLPYFPPEDKCNETPPGYHSNWEEGSHLAQIENQPVSW